MVHAPPLDRRPQLGASLPQSQQVLSGEWRTFPLFGPGEQRLALGPSESGGPPSVPPWEWFASEGHWVGAWPPGAPALLRDPCLPSLCPERCPALGHLLQVHLAHHQHLAGQADLRHPGGKTVLNPSLENMDRQEGIFGGEGRLQLPASPG